MIRKLRVIGACAASAFCVYAQATTGVAYVQANYATPQTPQTAVSVTFNSAQTAGDLNVIVVGWNNSTSSVKSVTDITGNVYQLAVGPTSVSGNATQSIYYALNKAAAAAGANTVTVTFNAGAPYPDVRILEYSGVNPTSPIDVAIGSSGTSASTSSGTATTSFAPDLILGANYVATGSGVGVGFTRRVLTAPDADVVEDRTVSATGSYAATAPVSPAGWWVMQMVALRGATSTNSFALTVTNAGTGSGSVTSSPAGIICPTTCTASFGSGTPVTLTATPAAGSTFAGWSGACTGTGTCSVTMSQAQAVTATFTAASYSLTVTNAGTGSGSVTSGPAGISCPTICTASFGSGTPVTLTATPAAGSTFAGWSGTCTGTGTCLVTMSQAQAVTATFTAATGFGLTVTDAGAGSGSVMSSPAGITCPTTCTANFASGAVVTLTAAPAAGSTFAGWSGACTGTATCAVTMSQAQAVTATFTTASPGLTVTDAGTGSGSVTSSPAGITCPTTCTASFASGTVLTLTAAPAAGATFAGWSGACTGTGTCTVTMSVAQAVTATFNAGPALAYVQANYATPQTPQSVVSVKFNYAQTAGNLNVVVVGWNDSTSSISSVTDISGNVYQLAVGPTTLSGSASQSIYYAQNIAAPAPGANSITVTFNGAAPYPDVRILEYSGVDPVNPIDIAVGYSGNSAAASSGTGTTVHPYDLILGANYVATGSGVGTGFTSRILTAPDADIVEDQIVSVAGDYAATAPLTPSGWWVMQMVALRGSSAGGGFALTVNDGGTGSGSVKSSPAGLNCLSTCTVGFASGTTVTLTATPAAGSTFAGWSGACTGTGTCTLTMTQAQAVTATFTVAGYALTVTNAGTGTGSVTSSPAGITCPTTCTSTFATGSAVTLTATPAAGSTFANWSGACTGTGTCAVTMTKAQAVTATFNGNGIAVSVSPARAGLTLGQAQQITATVSGATNTAVTWDVDGTVGGSATLGTVSPTGLYTPPAAAGIHTVTATSQADATKQASATMAVTDLAGVFTYHNDVARTGQNLQEYALNPINVANPATFGQVFTCPVDAAIYAQPLYMANLAIGGGTHNVVFVVTENNSVYAFDADGAKDPITGNCLAYWYRSFLMAGVTAVPSTDTGGGPDLPGTVGITGTPVINGSTIYMVARFKATATSQYTEQLRALDVATGSDIANSPVTISASVPGTAQGGTTVTFNPLTQAQRPGLLALNTSIYVAFGSLGDGDPYNGWLLAYDDQTLLQTAVFNSTPNGGHYSRGAFWMGGDGPATDGTYIYIATANGIFDNTSNTVPPAAPTNDMGDSLLKLDSTLTLRDFYTPSDQSVDQQGDRDFGSGGVIVLPNSMGSTSHPRLVIATGKPGNFYMDDRDAMARYLTGAGGTDGNVQTLSAGGAMFSTPAAWGNTLYVAPQALEAFPVTNGQIGSMSSKTNDFYAQGGATPSITAQGATNGIVWVLNNSANGASNSSGWGPAVLRAYDATNLTKRLYSSDASAADTCGYAVKFTVPTVANGKVYVGGAAGTAAGQTGQLTVYGLKP